MTDLLSDIDAPSDAELISRVRGGDVAAYGELFSRHVEAANRLGRQLARGPDVDDLVSEAFAKVLQVLQGGGGPDVAFRAYLLTAVRRLHVDRMRAGQKVQTSDDMSQFDPGIPFQDTAVADFENGAAAKAFASLPERWQLVLWHLEVEGQKPADIATLLGMSANSVSALAYRAREGLRQAFLTMHLADISAEQCRWVNEHLGAYVRKGLSRRDTAKVESHLDECRRCTAMYLELTEVNSNLRGIIAPLLLGAAASGYLASSGGAATGGLMSLVGRLRDTVVANTGAATASAVAAGVAAVATAGIFIANTAENDVVAGGDQPVAITSPNAAPPPQLPGATSDSPGDGDGSDEAAGRSSSSTSDGPGTVVPVHDSESTETPTTPSAEPTEDPGTTDGAPPGDVPAGDDQGPGSGGTTDGPSDQPSTGPTSKPTTPPGTTPPATTPPVTDPPTSGPPTTQPTTAPTTTPPTTAPPTTPPETTEPPKPQRPSADLRLGSVSVGPAGTLSVTVDGVPGDLVTLDVDLTSQHTTFARATTDCPVVTGRHAECFPTTEALGGGLAPVRVAAPESLTIELPLAFPEGMTSDELTVTVTARTHSEKNPTDNTSDPIVFTPTPTTPPATEVDLSLSGLTQESHTVRDGVDEYVLSTRVSGVPQGLESLTFQLSGNASYGEPTTVGCIRVDGTTLTCSEPTESFDLDFTVLTATGEPEPVTITVTTPNGYTDTVAANNSVTSTLVPAPRVDLAIDDLIQVGDSADTTFLVRTRVTGAPTGLPALAFPVSLPTGATLDAATGEGADCSISDDTIVCAEPAPAFDLTFIVTLPDTQPGAVSLSVAVPDGYVDTDATDNGPRTITLDADEPTEPEMPASDLAFGGDGLAVLEDRINNEFVLGATLTGLPKAPADVNVQITITGDGRIEEGPANCASNGDGAWSCSITDGQDLELRFVVMMPGKKAGRFELTASYGTDFASTSVAIHNDTPGGSSASN